MAYEDRGRYRGRAGWRSRDEDERWGPETEWGGDRSFGAGWGNQVAGPQRFGDRNWRGQGDDPAYEDRYRGGGGGFGYGRFDLDGGYRSGGFGSDAEFYGGPRFDRADVGSVGTHGVHPVASASSPAYGGGGLFGSSARDFALRREAARHDPHYHDWRHRQMAEIDRDYLEYREENQARFDREFSDWRVRRSEQRASVAQVKAHMEVVGSDGAHVGTVDKTTGDRIVLTRSDASAGGVHHDIPCGWIQSVADKVMLNLTADEAQQRWRTEGRSRALFEREDSGERGPHVLNRSFAGTYPDEE